MSKKKFIWATFANRLNVALEGNLFAGILTLYVANQISRVHL